MKSIKMLVLYAANVVSQDLLCVNGGIGITGKDHIAV